MREHYDRGNDFFGWFLGERMVYTRLTGRENLRYTARLNGMRAREAEGAARNIKGEARGRRRLAAGRARDPHP